MAAMPTRAATPPILPPTIAPVWSEPLLSLELVPGAAVAADPVELVELVDEEAVIEVASVVVAGDGIVIVVRVPVVSDFGDDEGEVVAEVADTDPVPSVVGVARELGLCVKDISAVVSTIAEGTPEALASTVAARSVAVPQPNCEYPPSNTLL